MASYYLAPSLKTLRAEVDRAHPNRDRTSDGWIGDASHSAGVSDHNPDYPDGGVVRALDVDKDGVNMDRLLSTAVRNPSTNYVIWNGYIYTRAYAFRKRVYNGVNKHDKHMHISILHGRTAENRTANWGYSPSTAVPSSAVISSSPVKSLQLAVRATADGQWGPTTDKHMDALRMSSGYHGGKHPFGVKFTQLVVGAVQDGSWGPASINAHHATTANVCRALTVMGFKVAASPSWTPVIERAYQGARAKYRR